MTVLTWMCLQVPVRSTHLSSEFLDRHSTDLCSLSYDGPLDRLSDYAVNLELLHVCVRGRQKHAMQI